MVPGTWLVVASAVAGVGTVFLIGSLWQYRDKPGARWFLVSLGGQAVWSGTYAAALLVSDPALRFALEVVVWAAMATMSVTFLAFALGYTGRGRFVRTRVGRVLLALPVGVAVAVATNPWHGLVWTGFEVLPVAGVATASYALQPWALTVAAVGALFPIVASVLLLDTVVSYGPLYRREAVAVGLSTLPPTAALYAWLFGLGPVPTVNFATVLFLPHVLFDAYAFVRSDMFEFHPATRRTGERAALDDLGNPVVIVDEQGRVVTVNAAAATLLDVDRRAALTNPLDDYLDGDSLDPTVGDQRVTIERDGAPHTFNVTARPLRDGGDTHVGYTVVFQDVTEELQREQRLEVLNRVLRHNLRNDMTVVHGFTTTANDLVDDEEVSGMLDTVERKADELVALGEKARSVEQIVAREPRQTPVALDDLLASVVEDLREAFPERSITLECSPATLETDEETLRVVTEALVENALQHGSPDGGDAVRVDVDAGVESVTVRVADEGPGVPDQELAVIDSGRETDLEHSTGLGLWLASWGARQLGGDLAFDVSDDGTVASLTLPRRGTDD